MKNLNVTLPGTQQKAVVPVKKSGGVLTLNVRDILKGLLIAGVAGAWIVLYQAISIWINGSDFDIVWMDVARSGVSGIMGYLSINLFQQSRVVIKAKDLEV